MPTMRWSGEPFRIAVSGSASPSGPTKYVIASVALMMTWTPFDESCRETQQLV